MLAAWDIYRSWARISVYALRTMRRSPAITAVAIASLALGIGANTAVFSLIDAILLKSLPVAHPERLVRFGRVSGNGPLGNLSYPFFLQVREANSATADLFASNRAGSSRVVAPGGSDTEQAAKEMVTGGYFDVLGVRAIIGRTLTPEDDHIPNGNPVAVISYRYWKHRFALDPSIVGKRLTIVDVPFTVIGVAPPEFFGIEVGSATDIWVPLATMPQKKWLSQNGFNFLSVVGRLKSGAGIDQARASSRVLMSRMIADSIGGIKDPRRRANILSQRLDVEPAAAGFSRLREQFSEPLRVLFAIVAAVLLVARSNIANLQLARTSARRREIGVRLAIGAGRMRLIRQLLTESVLLSVAGGLCGIGVAYWGCSAVLRFIPKSELPLVLDLQPDMRVLAFTMGLSVLSGIVFGLGPALHTTRVGLDSAMRAESRSAGYNPTQRWLGRSLISCQVALSMLLLIGSGLFIRSLMKLRSADMGFDGEHVLTFGVNVLSSAGVPQARDLMSRVVERAQTIPGVRAASFSFAGMYGAGGWTTELHASGYVPHADEPAAFDGALVGPRYFETLGIPILAGRDFTERDQEGAPKVVAVNQSLARHFWGGATPIGRRVRFERQEGSVEAEVVGVVKDVQHHGARKGPPAMFYAPLLQNTALWPTFVIRGSGDPRKLIATLTSELKDAQRGLQVETPLTLDELVNASLARERLVAGISGFFSVIALLLVCIGIYGTLAYSVTRRTAEVGVRMTLGARRAEVLWMVLGEALLLVFSGVVAGGLAARAATKWMSSLLFGLQPGDLTTIAVAGGAMLVVAGLAGYLTARRAASLDPLAALRYE